MELRSEKGKAIAQTRPDPESSVLCAVSSSGIPRGGQGTLFLSHNLGATGNLLKIMLQRKGGERERKGEVCFPHLFYF